MKDKLYKLFKFLISKVFLFNFLGAIAFIFIVIVVLNIYLKFYTQHGKSVTVPTLIGMQTEDAIALLKNESFDYVIIDTIFDDNVDKGAIAEQTPEPEALVKKGRKLYLIVNSKNDEMISMPQFVGYSIRQANSLAESYGLVVGNLRYVPDIAANVVIRQLHDGDEIIAGTKIKKGSKIDMILGLGLSDKTTLVPSLIGLTYKKASNNLLDLFLNTGAVNYDETVRNRKDSINAKVYKQSPGYSTINEVNLGYNVDIWLTADESLIEAKMLEAEETAENAENETE
ncbi:MAG: PASTA domain-containing protein [Bacteroidales bacterium]|nr:PASTA domain-containing protein [Bacteroidales bacterium]MDD4215837.1 PASTA domain-containing protein [Bacteroidales bacterium]